MVVVIKVTTSSWNKDLAFNTFSSPYVKLQSIHYHGRAAADLQPLSKHSLVSVTPGDEVLIADVRVLLNNFIRLNKIGNDSFIFRTIVFLVILLSV